MLASIINCNHRGWGFQLVTYLNDQREVVLINLDFVVHRRFCEGSADRFGVGFKHDAGARTVRFRRTPNYEGQTDRNAKGQPARHAE